MLGRGGGRVDGGWWMGGVVAVEFHLSQNTQRRITERVQSEHRHCCFSFLLIASFTLDTGLYSVKRYSEDGVAAAALARFEDKPRA